jgi:hypothetical protein
MSEQLTIEIQMPQRPVRYWYKVRTKDIRVIDGDTIECLNVKMVAEGHAVPYMIEIIQEDSFEVKK